MRSAQETARSILGINAALHAELPGAHIVSLAILPKGETWPNRCSDAILTVNAELQVQPPHASCAFCLQLAQCFCLM